jgi:hypothetical protein
MVTWVVLSQTAMLPSVLSSQSTNVCSVALVGGLLTRVLEAITGAWVAANLES